MDLGLVYPVREPITITQYYGENAAWYQDVSLHPGWSYPGHNGIDFAGWAGDVVLSVCDTRINKVGFEDEGYGNYIRGLLPNGWWVYYAHLMDIIVELGQKVKAGDVIGTVGATGYATGTHLYLGLKDPKKEKADSSGYKGYVNPLLFFLARPSPLTPLPPVVEGQKTAKMLGGVNMRSAPMISSTIYGVMYMTCPPIAVDEIRAMNNGDIWARSSFWWFAVNVGMREYSRIESL
jgi:murein DD-endopeptidase MepM/ murein hydrolase activator NlpD